MANAKEGGGGRSCDAPVSATTDAVHDDQGVEKIAPELAGQEFAVGLYMSMWPKVEKCDAYVSMLLDTQEQLHQKIKELTESLTGTEDVEKLDESQSPLVDYAVRLQKFPNRVQVLQAKLEGIRSMLNTVRNQQGMGPASSPSSSQDGISVDGGSAAPGSAKAV
ncbi:Aste57867_18709 [Aphanomyces stellatus]|uniref:Aste57867_18709 protein n=1 Tax=Aphanomyces stellatus TaxID=120398 RepID=A0A485LBN8_9STRA|nr:hypothetical protein As57867_018645 [Aphanomyces stellatus]VFT95443.1 Aste57867_18709 [Aphanomyces stellatus]